MTEATQATFASQTIAVEHIKISSERSFAEVRRRLEGTLPMLDASIAELLRSGDQKHATEYEVSGPKLSIFEERDHGSLLQAFGRPPVEDFRRDSDLFGEGARNPEAQRRFQAALKRGFQTRDAEMDLAGLLGGLADD
jgi:hypothetical protein